MKAATSTHWSDVAEVGTIWGLKAVVLLVRILGTGIVRVVLYPIVFYYFVTNRRARDASLEYLRRIHAFDPMTNVRPTLAWSYRHFMSFAESLVARVAAWTGRITVDDLDYTGREILLGLIEHRQGALLLGAHLGNLEVCRALSRARHDMRLNVIVSTSHAEKFNRVMRSLTDDPQLELVEVSRFDPAVAMRLQKKIAAGEFIVITGDRIPASSDRTNGVEFLGGTAQLPQGPFILAALLKCPVYTFFCVKEGRKHRICCDHLSDRIKLVRGKANDSLQEPMQRFATTLETYCRRTPLQWFNFYPFWESR